MGKNSSRQEDQPKFRNNCREIGSQRGFLVLIVLFGLMEKSAEQDNIKENAIVDGSSTVPQSQSGENTSRMKVPSCPIPVFEVDLNLGRWDSKRMVKMYDHTLLGDNFIELSKSYSVCLATQSSLEKLHSLVDLADHWNGSISAALFAAGNEEFGILQIYVSFLRNCYAQIKQRVSFHLAFPSAKLPTTKCYSDKLSTLFDCKNPDSTMKALLQLRTVEITKWKRRYPYPQNHLRNLARKNCQTSLVFMTDVDVFPSIGMADALNQFFKEQPFTSLVAYVVPTYELDRGAERFPKNKSELLKLIGRGLARPFHERVFPLNQRETDFKRWEMDLLDHVHVSHKLSKNLEFQYEPFYVASDSAPPHDERFTGYGYTKSTQVYEMIVAGWRFEVLSPIFTAQWGFEYLPRPKFREKQTKINSGHARQFLKELAARYQRHLNNTRLI